MIKMPYDEILEKIEAGSDLSKEDIENRVKQKMDQLSGLISKEGAAHIIANELNIRLFEKTSGRLKIKNIFPGIRDVEVVGKVVKTYEIKEFKVGAREGKVASLIIADETGSIRTVMWNSVADNLEKIKEADVVKIQSAYCRENNGYKELHLNERSTIDINPEGEDVGEVNVSVQAPQAEQKSITDLSEGENALILGTVVDMFDPRFFEICSECNKRVKNEEMKCQNHPEAEIKFSYVLNVFLDDGTDNIRCVFFRELLEKFLSKNYEELMTIKDSPEQFADVKKNILGKIIKIKGRVIKNQMFDRLEFMVNDVDNEPDPKEEIKRLEKEK